MLEYRRYRDAGSRPGAVRRQAPLPLPSGAAAARAAGSRSRPPGLCTRATASLKPSEGCCARRRRQTPRTSGRPSRSSAGSASCAICSRAESWTSTGSSVTTTRLTQAVTIFALLELHKRGEGGVGAGRVVRADSDQFSVLQFSVLRMERRWRDGSAAVGADHRGVVVPGARAGLRSRSWWRPPTPPKPGSSARSTGSEGTFADGARGLVLRNVAGGLDARPPTRLPRRPARKLLSRPKTPPLTQAQAETLAIVAYLQPVSRPEISRIRGVSGEVRRHVQDPQQPGLIEESGQSRFGATIYRTTPCSSGCSASPGSTRSPTPRASIHARGRAGPARAPAQGRGAARRVAGWNWSTVPRMSGFGDRGGRPTSCLNRLSRVATASRPHREQACASPSTSLTAASRRGARPRRCRRGARDGRRRGRHRPGS